MAKQRDWGEWQEVDRSDSYYLMTANDGPAGSGKTHFLLTAPEPIAVHLFDPGGLEGLKKNPLFKKKDIRVMTYDISLGKYKEGRERQEAAIEILEKFSEQQNIALKNARTIGWDKEDYLWKLTRYARLGKNSDRPTQYDELNMEYQAYFHDLEMAGVNFCAIRGMKEKWGDSASAGGTGEFIGRGMKEVPELCQIHLQHRWDRDAKEFVTTILDKCRVGDEPKTLMGTEHIGLTFRELGEMIYPETAEMDESPWE
jgi:hypothetical protein